MKNVLSMRLLQFLAALCLLSVIPTNAAQSGYFTYYTINANTGVILTGYTGSGGAVTIPSSIDGIPLISVGTAFANKASLTSVTIPNGVTEVGSSAFYGCSGLASVTIPDSVTSIGPNAFTNCRSLTSVTLPNSVIYISDSAFYGCSGLTSMIIGRGDFSFR